MYKCGIGVVTKDNEWNLIQFLSNTEEEIPFIFGENYKTKDFTQEQSNFFWAMIHETGFKNDVDIVEIQFEEISDIGYFAGVYSHNEFHKF